MGPIDPAETVRASLSYFDVQGLHAHTGQGQDLEAAAAQFESLFVHWMLRSMRAAGEAFAEDSYLSSPEVRSQQQMLDQQLAVHLSENGGLGLRDLIVAQLGGSRAGADQELASPADRVIGEPAVPSG